MHLRHGRQAVGGEARPAARLWRRGGHLPTDVDPDERSYYRVLDRIARETPGAWAGPVRQPANPEAHYLTTGPEIWDATERVTHLVVALGTGGTVSGAGRYLHERNPAVQVVGADPAGSVYSGPIRTPT